MATNQPTASWLLSIISVQNGTTRMPLVEFTNQRIITAGDNRVSVDADEVTSVEADPSTGCALVTLSTMQAWLTNEQYATIIQRVKNARSAR